MCVSSFLGAGEGFYCVITCRRKKDMSDLRAAFKVTVCYTEWTVIVGL